MMAGSGGHHFAGRRRRDVGDIDRLDDFSRIAECLDLKCFHVLPPHQHHSAEGAVFDQVAEGFRGLVELVRSFEDRLHASELSSDRMVAQAAALTPCDCANSESRSCSRVSRSSP